jgi:putative membrane protein
MSLAIGVNTAAKGRDANYLLLWFLLACYAAARFLPLMADKVPVPLIAALHILPALLFAWFHGMKSLGRRPIVIFFTLFLLVGNLVENLGVATGFPFGHYYFTHRMGPKLFHVPILLGLAYLGMGYVSWTLASLILGQRKDAHAFAGFRIIALPLLASFLMVAWDLSQDPVWSTIERCWVWPQGGAYFGVPVTNFLGWFLNVYLFYQIFALYLRRSLPNFSPLPPRYSQLAIFFYAVCAAGNLLLLLGTPPGGITVVVDPAGTPWNIRDILGSSALVSLFTMGAFAFFAWVRLADQGLESTSP